MLDFEYCKQRDPEHCEKSDFHVIPMFENILVWRFSIFHVHVHGGLSWAKLEVKAGHPELYLGLGQEHVEKIGVRKNDWTLCKCNVNVM